MFIICIVMCGIVVVVAVVVVVIVVVVISSTASYAKVQSHSFDAVRF